MRKALYVIVIVIGSLQIMGYLTQIKPLRQLGAVTSSSPLPIVFTEVKGVETYASDFFMEFTDTIGNRASIQITPEMYSKLEGPYNRRNVYGAAISYGPVFPEEIWKSILNYGICNDVLTTEMGLSKNISDVSILVKTKTQGRNEQWILKPDC